MSTEDLKFVFQAGKRFDFLMREKLKGVGSTGNYFLWLTRMKHVVYIFKTTYWGMLLK